MIAPVHPPPSGTLTFLFSDIEGSTALWDRRPDAMRRALEVHDRLLRQAMEGAGGYVFKTVGDAFCVAFATAPAALRAALEAQRALAREAWAEIDDGLTGLKVRIGIHSGVATERDGDYFGPPVNRTARIESAGQGGQVLLSLAAQQLAREDLPPGCRLVALGTHRLRDLQHTETLFALEADDLSLLVTPPHSLEPVHPRDRILVAEGLAPQAAPDSVPDTLQRVLDALRDENAGHTVTLTTEQLNELSRHRPANLTEYRLGRIAEWSQAQYRLDGRFVELTLLIDRGEEVTSGRWQPQAEQFEDLRGVLGAVPEPALVLLGPPGGGKSTLLRRLELDIAIDCLRDAGKGAPDTVTFFIQLSQFKALAPGQPRQDPAAWLAESWARRFPELPAMDRLLQEGRMVLLLDALNEMPASDEADYYRAVGLWKDFLHRLAATPGNRVLLSCRSLEYSAPLSSPSMRVPQVRIEPLTDSQVQRFLELYSPAQHRHLWEHLAGSPQLALLRSPYFLKLLTEQAEVEGAVPEGRAGLFTGFVRQALRREVERGAAVFQPGHLLDLRDLRRITGWQWRDAWDLPERGPLLKSLGRLAYDLQIGHPEHKAAQVQVSLDEALDLLGDGPAEDILKAGTALAVLDEDPVNDAVLFIHQLLQEYFAARSLALRPEEAPTLVTSAWQSEDVRPTLAEVEAQIAAADPLPLLPRTGWEETVVLAVAMTAQPETLIRTVAEVNLPLAGRCAAQPELRLDPALRADLQARLLARSRDPRADLRARIEAGQVLGSLGDPRLTAVDGPDGRALVPPLAAFAAGPYRIGRDDSDDPDERPAHEVPLAAFALGLLPVSNAEWSSFMAADGYEDLRWWDTAAARSWQQGEGTMDGLRRIDRYWLEVYRAHPEQLEAKQRSGLFSQETYERWQKMLAMDEAGLEALLHELYPGGALREPRYWRDERFNQPTQPVVGVSWFEARAYANWLAAQTGQPFRLPREPEWEAAARGPEGRLYAYGDRFDATACNAIETHIRGITPIGVFPAGDTPEGMVDMTGNTWDWTLNLASDRLDRIAFRYPYSADDGREDTAAGPEMIRVARGGGWCYGREHVITTMRYTLYPDARNYNLGVRLACGVEG